MSYPRRSPGRHSVGRHEVNNASIPLVGALPPKGAPQPGVPLHRPIQPPGPECGQYLPEGGHHFIGQTTHLCPTFFPGRRDGQRPGRPGNYARGAGDPFGAQIPPIRNLLFGSNAPGSHGHDPEPTKRSAGPGGPHRSKKLPPLPQNPVLFYKALLGQKYAQAKYQPGQRHLLLYGAARARLDNRPPQPAGTNLLDHPRRLALHWRYRGDGRSTATSPSRATKRIQ